MIRRRRPAIRRFAARDRVDIRLTADRLRRTVAVLGGWGRPECGGIMANEAPFSRMALRVAAIGGVASLAVAALIVFWAKPTVERSYGCDTPGGMVAVAGFVALLGGLGIAALGVSRAIVWRWWPAALVAFGGFALAICAIAAMYLYAKTWGSFHCQPG